MAGITLFCYHVPMADDSKPSYENKGGNVKKNGRGKGPEKLPLIKKETQHTVLGIIFSVLAVFFFLAPFAMAGIAGTALYNVLELLFGAGFFLLPLLFLLLGISFFKSIEPHVAARVLVGSLLFFLSGLGLLGLPLADTYGGLIGHYVALPLEKFFDIYASALFLFALFLISLVVIFDARPKAEFFSALLAPLRALRNRKKEMGPDLSAQAGMKVTSGGETLATIALSKEVEASVSSAHNTNQENDTDSAPRAPEMLPKKKSEEEEFAEEIHEKKVYTPAKNFVPPPLSLLEKDSGRPDVGDVKGNANIIRRTLSNFGIVVEMDEVSIGPSVTRYALKPAEGVKLAKIIGLTNELALALAAHPVRVEAPIPGTSLVGIEVPNRAKTTVGLATALSTKEFQDSPHPLLASLGKSISGKCHFANIAKMPHLLIAGATGSGKSVMVHTMITSLLYRNSPDTLRFIMIDPKRVELTLYNGIPQLFTPVITDAKRAIMALRWAAKEMDRRYDLFEGEAVRDIQSYHKNIPDGEPLPYIVIVIDELADIMQSYPRELEAAIVRLAQMSRAVGIHLVLSTQRPSVNVITGLIKANIPSRIALQVSSQIDSRTILDASGAEKLLGAGDMLYMSGEMSKPIRLQSAFVSEGEVKKVVQYLVKQYEDTPPDEITLSDLPDKNAIFSTSLDPDGASGDDDDLYEDARMAVIEAGKASTSYLQRKLKIGYARAARLIDLLEERGVVGPGDGAKPREVLESRGGVVEEMAGE